MIDRTAANGRLRSSVAGLKVRAATAVQAESAAGGASHRGSLPGGCAPVKAIPSGLRACRNRLHGSACSALWHGRPAVVAWPLPGHSASSASAPQRVRSQGPPRQSRTLGEPSLISPSFHLAPLSDYIHRYSCLMSAAFTASRHSGASLRIKAANSAGVLAYASTPILFSLSTTPGSRAAFATSCAMR